MAWLHCRDNSTKLTGHFDGYVEVKSRDEAAVMEALMRHGPLAVGVDASSDDFLLYRWAETPQPQHKNFCASFLPPPTLLRSENIVHCTGTWCDWCDKHCLLCATTSSGVLCVVLFAARNSLI
jgi:hypothetical protein